MGLYREQSGNLYTADQIHPTELGGYNLAQGVWSYLKTSRCGMLLCQHRRLAMMILIAWRISQAVGLLLWQPLGRAATRGDEDDAVPQSELP